MQPLRTNCQKISCVLVKFRYILNYFNIIFFIISIKKKLFLVTIVASTTVTLSCTEERLWIFTGSLSKKLKICKKQLFIMKKLLNYNYSVLIITCLKLWQAICEAIG